MKKIVFILLCCFVAVAHGQTWQSKTATIQTRTVSGDKQLRILWDATQIFNLSDSLSSAAEIIPAGPISTLPTVGFNPGTNISPGQWIQAVFYQTTPPTATLTGGVSQERLPTGANLSYSLNWTYGRAATTNTIASAVITGASQTYPIFGAQPAAPGTISGSQSVNVPRNTTSTFTNTVVTTDGKSIAPTTSFSFYDRRYAGFATSALQGDGTPTDANIIAAQFKDNNGANILITTTLAQQPSDRYMFVATTSPINNININGFPQNAAFNLNISRVFINTVGGSQTYYISVSKNPFGSISTSAVITN